MSQFPLVHLKAPVSLRSTRLLVIALVIPKTIYGGGLKCNSQSGVLHRDSTECLFGELDDAPPGKLEHSSVRKDLIWEKSNLSAVWT